MVSSSLFEKIIPHTFSFLLLKKLSIPFFAVTALVVTASYLAGSDLFNFAGTLLPIFVLSGGGGGDGGCGGGGGDGGGGDGGGAGGACAGGCTSAGASSDASSGSACDCTCMGSNCSGGPSGACACDCGSGGGGDSGGGTSSSGGGPGGSCSGTGPSCPSTPFLCTWNGEKFVFENDVLFGKPNSLFPNYEAGKYAYENKRFTTDLYKISNQVCTSPTGSLTMQLREIEPEESYIDTIALAQVIHPVNTSLVVTSNFSGYSIFKNADIRERRGLRTFSVQDHKQQRLTEKLADFDTPSTTSPVHMLEAGQYVTITGTVNDTSAPHHFVMGALYRDWTLGDIYDTQDVKLGLRSELSLLFSEPKSISLLFSRTAKVLMLLVIFIAVWTINLGSSTTSLKGQGSTAGSDPAINALTSTFNAKRAHADFGCRSLVIEYLKDGHYRLLDVIQPRYYQRTLEAIKIPSEAIDESSSSFSLRVRATKRHAISYASVFSPSKIDREATEERLPLLRATHARLEKDLTATLNTERNQVYAHTIPSDTIELEFSAPKKTSSHETSSLILRAAGFYTPLSAESKVLAGNWVSRLAPESRSVLDSLHALKSS